MMKSENAAVLLDRARSMSAGRDSVNLAAKDLRDEHATRLDRAGERPSLAELQRHTQLAIIGGGPAGLRAAEVAASAGMQVTIFDGKPSVGRKFLIAGKGGLNLTHGEDFETFVTRYPGVGEIWRSLLADFDAPALQTWAAELGIETFQASSGRIYPKTLKGAPLLRRWIERLRGLGVEFAMNHRWSDFQVGCPHQLEFTNGEIVTADAVVFALGGGSWARTGSDGGWLPMFKNLEIRCRPLMPANCGWECAWSDEILRQAEGKPLKNLHVRAGDQQVIGELLVTRYGLEGGAIYQLGAALRTMDEPQIAIDFKPTFTEEQLVRKMESVRGDFLRHAQERWKLSEAASAIFGRMVWNDTASLAREVKHCVIRLSRPRPLDEAISSAGGVCWDELDDSLMLTKIPGIFLAGEMIDWEAPTGGYLLQGCFATGTRAGRAAANWLLR